MPISLFPTQFYHFHFQSTLAEDSIHDLRVQAMSSTGRRSDFEAKPLLSIYISNPKIAAHIEIPKQFFSSPLQLCTFPWATHLHISLLIEIENPNFWNLIVDWKLVIWKWLIGAGHWWGACAGSPATWIIGMPEQCTNHQPSLGETKSLVHKNIQTLHNGPRNRLRDME